MPIMLPGLVGDDPPGATVKGGAHKVCVVGRRLRDTADTDTNETMAAHDMTARPCKYTLKQLRTPHACTCTALTVHHERTISRQQAPPSTHAVHPHTRRGWAWALDKAASPEAPRHLFTTALSTARLQAVGGRQRARVHPALILDVLQAAVEAARPPEQLLRRDARRHHAGRGPPPRSRLRRLANNKKIVGQLARRACDARP